MDEASWLSYKQRRLFAHAGPIITGKSKGDYTLIKKENQIFPMYKEIQNETVAKSYTTLQLLHCEFPYM
jgi:hypothetical protein